MRIKEDNAWFESNSFENGIQKIYKITRPIDPESYSKQMSDNSIVSKYYIVSADCVINIIEASHFVL